jgi:DNA polymerase III subunit delta'
MFARTNLGCGFVPVNFTHHLANKFNILFLQRFHAVVRKGIVEYNQAMSWNLLGNEWAVQLLIAHAAHEKMKHAYLFTGPTGVGRRTMALKFAQAVNCPCPAAPGIPCGQCSTCKRLFAMQHPDLAVVQADQTGGILKVDQIRELQHFLSLSPYEARYRFALLLRFEEANQNAANALLKSLEEPSPQVILALTAESAESLLPTIVSRCEIIRLSPLQVKAASEGISTLLNVSSERARLLAHLSNGRPGYAIRLQENEERMVRRQDWLDEHQNLLKSNRLTRFAFAEGLSKDKETLRQVLLVWLSFWRDVLLLSSGTSAPITNLDRESEIQALADRFSIREAYDIISSLERTLHLMERNVNPRLALEVLLLDMPKT